MSKTDKIGIIVLIVALAFGLMMQSCLTQPVSTNVSSSQNKNAKVEPVKTPDEVSYPDRLLVLTIAKYCSNPEAEINDMVDHTVTSIGKLTGKPSSRAVVIAQALSIIEDAKKDKKYPRNKDGKFEFGAIAMAVQAMNVEHSSR